MQSTVLAQDAIIKQQGALLAALDERLSSAGIGAASAAGAAPKAKPLRKGLT